MVRAARNRLSGILPGHISVGGWALALLLAVLSAAPARAQLGDEIPGQVYYASVEAFYLGEYRDAERELRRETQRGVRTTQSRWVDAICYHAMLGEVYYHQGRNADALAEFDQACQMLTVYPNWLLRIKADPLRPATVVARRIAPWGQSERQIQPADLTRTLQIAVGQLDNRDVIRQGGVVMQPQYWRVNGAEIVRASCLAMRRRAEILGPLAPQDRLFKELSEVFSRGNLSPANHWSGAWVDLERGMAQAALGKFDEADTLLGRATLIGGQFDHPLTCVALLEQGRIAMQRGNTARAAKMLAEAGFSAYYFENWDVLTESVWLGWLNHVTSGGGGMYPALVPVATWAQSNRMQHMAVKLRLAQAESLLIAGQAPQASALLEDIGRRMGEMRAGLSGIHELYLQAITRLTQGQVGPGGVALGQALAAQASASLRNFQIVRVNEMYDNGAVSPRVANDLFADLLADPTPLDWVLNPLDAMAVLRSNHDAAFDRWFVAALGRKDVPLALEVAEAAKRRRFLAALPLGGRLAALRMILEAPDNELSSEAVLQRQQLLGALPTYRDLSAAGSRLQAELRGGPVLAKDTADAKKLADRYDAWGENADQREQLLMQLSLRRVPTSLEFPPVQKAVQLQRGLAKGEAIAIFHSAAGSVYGFLVTRDDVHAWQLGDVRRLRTALGGFLRDLGNYSANRALSVAELKSDRWRESAAKTYEALFGDARLDLAKTSALVIVPDDALWYLPFEALVPNGATPSVVLGDRLPLCYGPTASLAVGDRRPVRRPQHTGIVANEFVADTSGGGGEESLQSLEKVVTGPVRLPLPLAEPGYLLSALLDELIVLDEVEPARDGAFGWSLMPRSKGATDDTLMKWFTLPYGGPERIVVTGYTTAAEQGLKVSRRAASRGPVVLPGNEIFQSVCGMMANGARTILLTRWRTGGNTNFELVREFVQELPNVPAADAWQRACVLAREAPLDAELEPRLKGADSAGELPTADHPFFWAGYLLVDSVPRPSAEEAAVAEDGKAAPGAIAKPGEKSGPAGPAAAPAMTLPTPENPAGSTTAAPATGEMNDDGKNAAASDASAPTNAASDEVEAMPKADEN